MQTLAIILCTYNGERFLQEQLDSFGAQTYKNWSLFVCDDGSKDRTKDLVENYINTQKQNHIEWTINNPCLGFAKNFLQGIKTTPDHFDYYALSDQDDIWMNNKLKRGIDYLKTIPQNIPALYCTRTLLVDGEANEIGLSPHFNKPPSFSNALVQSIAGGNTMIFNQSAHELISRARSETDVISHDWFIYQLITGAGGHVYYDPEPSLLYRQHGNNIIGSNIGMWARVIRIRKLINGSFKEWNNKHIIALQPFISFFTTANQKKFDLFTKARNQTIIARLLNFKKIGIYRQTFAGNIALIIAAILNKI
jgi:glycosyltransferase involved in cell wall biosynthesis